MKKECSPLLFLPELFARRYPFVLSGAPSLDFLTISIPKDRLRPDQVHPPRSMLRIGFKSSLLI